MKTVDEFVEELKKLQYNAPSPELRLLVKYMTLIALLGTMKEPERIRYVMNQAAMKSLTDTAIKDLLTLPAIAKRYERSKRHSIK